MKVAKLLKASPAPFELATVDPRSTPGFKGKKADSVAAVEALGARLSELQEMLYANGRSGSEKRLLLVLQGLDTSGKGGTVEHVLGYVSPAGVRHAAFGKPTKEELSHDFLWRIRRKLPQPGEIGVFDRSYYEDVVTVGVLGLRDRATVRRRFSSIDHFEAGLVKSGTALIKCFLHISPEEQRERLLARLDDPTKRWKFNPEDLKTRALWDNYQAAYSEAIGRCQSDDAPWYVIPADRKWYRNWAVLAIMVEHLEALALQWPEPTYDVEEARAMVKAA